MRILILILLVSGLLESCYRCSDDPRRPDPIVFYLANSTGENLVNDRGEPFHPDSIQARMGNKIIALEKFYDQQTNGYKFRAYPAQTLDKAIVYLDVSSSDTDTLEAYSIRHTGKCYYILEYTDVFFNGNKAESTSQPNEFVFIKK